MPTLNDASPAEVIQILTSELFTLVPSGSNSHLKIHQALLKSLSPAFRSTSEGGWAETDSGIHKFLENDAGDEADVTEYVLLCFITWAYLGDYKTETVGIKSIDTTEPFVFGGSRKVGYIKKKGRRSFSVGELDDDGTESAPEQASSTETTNMTNIQSVTLPHYLVLNVQIYVFANIYLIQDLKALSQQKIISYLGLGQKSRTDLVDAIFDVLNYSLMHLPDDDELLDWLAKYSSWKLEALRSDMGKFNALMQKSNGKLGGLLLRHVVPTHISPFQSPNSPYGRRY
ncbi:hypothetical protein EG329_006611 [Mollisiaceae sp. DMI_Dod_QoI]|nr:hypothetical protein EG329_006611 [Helotiales sp. DMI_Dod_QoI]